MGRHFTAVLALLLTSCAGHSLDNARPQVVTVVESSSLPTPDVSDYDEDERPYHVGPFDRLEIRVLAIPELANVGVQVDAGGRISFPLVGIIRVAGLTPFQIEDKIKDGLRGKYLRNPQVTVNVTDMVSQMITVTGEVRSPGLYPVIGRLTLLRAITLAKGTTEFSDEDSVVIFREVGGERYAALYNLKAIGQGRYPDPEVFAGDVVSVDDSRARRIFRDFITMSPLLSGPIILLLKGL